MSAASEYFGWESDPEVGSEQYWELYFGEGFSDCKRLAEQQLREGASQQELASQHSREVRELAGQEISDGR